MKSPKLIFTMSRGALGLSMALVSLLAASTFAADPGKAVGTVTIDGVTTALTLATESTKENLFDDKKTDTIITLTDRPLNDTDANDDIGLSLRARRGDLVVVMLRIDGAKLVNVSLMYKGLAGVDKLPGQWFQYAATAKSAGTLKLAKHENDGHSYACALEFAAAPAVAPKKTVNAPAPAKAAPAPMPAASTSNLDPATATNLLVAAIKQKDEHQALELIKLGVDPNSREKDGTAVLSWAVMQCMPAVVQALVDRKASLTYQRVPGFTIMLEAGACPAAAKILSAAGAR
jgi:hypothetical protein